MSLADQETYVIWIHIENNKGLYSKKDGKANKYGFFR